MFQINKKLQRRMPLMQKKAVKTTEKSFGGLQLLSLLLVSLLFVTQTSDARMFDSIVSYRQGTNAENEDAYTTFGEDQTEVPGSVDNVFGYTAANPENDTIEVIHCYSMRNGLFGQPTEARVFWTRIDFSNPDNRRSGRAENEKTMMIPIDSKIEQFAVYETDSTVFLLSQTNKLQIIMHVIPGPYVSERPMRTFTFYPEYRLEFNINELMIIPDAKKAIFYSQDHLGEISLEHYPFENFDDELHNPGIKIHKVHNSKQIEGSRPDFSEKSELMQVQPVYDGTKWTDQIFLLMSNVDATQTTLRIDAVKASEVLGTAVNIARINTNSEAAYKRAKFAEIAVEVVDETIKTHYFATFAYQSYPFEANFVTISAACEENGDWQEDRSQAFFITRDSLDDHYLKVLGIRKKESESSSSDKINFTVFLSGDEQPGYFYKMEFTVTKTDDNDEGFSLTMATLQKSILLDYSISQTKVAFFPEHLMAVNGNWPDFYMFITTTRQLTPAQAQQQGSAIKVKDGLLLSEQYLRRSEGFNLMNTSVDVLSKFEQNGDLAIDKRYSDSRILTPNDLAQPITYRTTLFTNTMQSKKKPVSFDKTSDVAFGNEWVKMVRECNYADFPFNQVPSFGFTEDAIMSNLNVELSTPENILANEMTLLQNTSVNGFQINNDYLHFVKNQHKNSCKYSKASNFEPFCGSMVALCFEEFSQIFKCDSDGKATIKSELFSPSNEDSQLASELSLVGDAFKLPIREDNNCYLSTMILHRSDDHKLLYFDQVLSKRLIIADPNEKPRFRVEPPLDWYAGVGEYFEIPFTNFVDPDGLKVLLVADFGDAIRFAYFDYDSSKIVIEEGATNMKRDAGVYQINIQLIEVINKAQMPIGQVYNLNLTVGEPIPPVPIPVLKVAPSGIPYPEARIDDFSSKGVMKIQFSKALNFPEDIFYDFNEIRQTEVPFYGESKKIEWIRNMIKISIEGGWLQDPEFLGFDFNITSYTSTEIEIKFDFEQPYEISQTQSPEHIFVTLNVENFTDSDGLAIYRDYNLTSYIPRIIPSEAAADSMQTLAIVLGTLLVLVIAFHFVVCIIYKKSFNNVWSVINIMQLVGHMPLFTVLFPANINYFLSYMIDFVTFEIFPRDSLPSSFEFDYNFEPFNLQFMMLGYKGRQLVQNARTMFILVLLYVAFCFVWVFIYALREKMNCKGKCVSSCMKCLNTVYPTYTSILFYGSLIRLAFEGYIRVCLSAFICLSDSQWGVNGSITFDNVFSIIMVVFICGLPCFIVAFLVSYIKDLTDDDFQPKYGNFYDGLAFDKTREKRLIAIFYPFWFVMRRLFFCIFVVAFDENCWFQIAFAWLFAIVNVSYIIKYQPFTDRKLMWLEIMNELTYFVLLYHVMAFSGLVDDSVDRYSLGWSFLTFVIANLLVHFVNLIYESYDIIRSPIKLRHRLKMAKEAGVIVDQEGKIKDPELSIIMEDEFESNHSEMDSEKKVNAEKISDSDWESKLGNSVKGYNHTEIRWKDLGRKYIIKKGKKSLMPDLDQSEMHAQQFHTIDDRFTDVNFKLRLNLDLQKVHNRPLSSKQGESKNIAVGLKYGIASRNEQKNLVNSDQGKKSQKIVYQTLDKDDGILPPIIETDRTIIDETSRKLVMINTCLNQASALGVNQVKPVRYDESSLQSSDEVSDRQPLPQKESQSEYDDGRYVDVSESEFTHQHVHHKNIPLDIDEQIKQVMGNIEDDQNEDMEMGKPQTQEALQQTQQQKLEEEFRTVDILSDDQAKPGDFVQQFVIQK